jgi:tetratricopeptide (TPR) repeat protein
MLALVVSMVVVSLGQAPAAPPNGMADLQAVDAALRRLDFPEALRVLDEMLARDLLPADRTEVLLRRAALLADRGRLDQALAAVDDVERLSSATREPYVLGRIARVRGTVAKHRGASLQAIDYYKQGLAWGERSGNQATIADAYRDLASIHQDLGDWSRALDYTARAFESQPGSSEAAQMNDFLQRGIALFELADRDRAERSFLDALALARRLGDRRSESFALGELGSLYWEIDGNRERALDHLEPAIALARSIHVPTLEIAWLNNLGRVLRDTDDPEALSLFERARDLELQTGRGRNLPMVFKNIGETLARQGRWAEAEEYLARARDEADRQNQPRFQWGTRMELGRLHASRDPARAEREFAASIDILEAHHSNVLLESFRAGAMSHSLTINNPYELYIDFLLDRGETARAFIVAERGRARAFLDTLSFAREEIGAAVPAEYVDAENALLREINMHQATLRTSDLAEADRTKASMLLRAAEERLTTLRVRLASDRPAVAHVRFPRLWSAEELQRDVIGPSETLLLFYLGRRGSAAWIVQRDRLEAVRLPPRATIELAVRRYLDNVNTPGVPDRAAARTMADLLVGGLEGRVPDGSRLVVVPHGILQYVPFEALIDGHDRYLIERYTVSYAPSASSLAYLRRPPGTRQRGRQVVAIGNPVTGGGAAATDRSNDIGWIADLQPLPHSRDELQRIGSIFGRSSRILEQDRATEAALAEAVEGAGVLHFATHGLIDEHHPDRSGLALSASPPGFDGLLQMREIYRLRIPATLVTLSACRTALGRNLTGEGLVGLSRAFFYAGADAVVASLWNVNDAASAQWMGTFYERVRDGTPIDEAMREVKLRFLRSDTVLNRPFYWAGFVVTGHAATTVPVGARRVVPASLAIGAVLLMALVYSSRRVAARRSGVAATGRSAHRAG